MERETGERTDMQPAATIAGSEYRSAQLLAQMAAVRLARASVKVFRR
jgi:hypothetical protein